jgi:hypothetical protein
MMLGREVVSCFTLRLSSRLHCRAAADTMLTLPELPFRQAKPSSYLHVAENGYMEKWDDARPCMICCSADDRHVLVPGGFFAYSENTNKKPSRRWSASSPRPARSRVYSPQISPRLIA